jgi:phosphoribosylformylglycinamidine synthase II
MSNGDRHGHLGSSSEGEARGHNPVPVPGHAKGHTRIEIALGKDREDPFARHMLHEISAALGITLRGLRIVDLYDIWSDLEKEELSRFAEEVLHDPILHVYAVDEPVSLELAPFTWALEISFKPGVTDNRGSTAAAVLRMMTGRPEADFRVHTATQYLMEGDLTREDVERVGREVLYNDLIQRCAVLHADALRAGERFAPREPTAGEEHRPQVLSLDLDLSDGELMSLSAERTLALTLEEMKFFRRHFAGEGAGRASAGLSDMPTDVELECFAQTQSEHCKHKIFNATITYREDDREEVVESLFATYIRGATERIARGGKSGFLVSVFTDNAGVIRFDEGHNLAFKVETHNSPSALDPYGGAITGIVGCDRDPAGTGLGARIIAHTDILCFGDPHMEGDLPPRMMHPRRIMAGVVRGIEEGGNKCGIPTVNGALLFDDSYRGKPLVFCGSVGIMPRRVGERPSHLKTVRPGDIVVMTGGRIGKDGIHGATFSSEEISETSPTQAVQIGDPITQKKMLDMLLEARDNRLYRAITDNGAGGLSSSVGEMARLCGGAEIDLKKAPLKYPGLDPWEILLSEAQERMTLAVPPEALDDLLALAADRDVLAVPIGRFTDSGVFQVFYGEKTVCRLDLEFLHASIPLRLEAVWEPPRIEEREPAGIEPGAASIESIILRMLSDLNGCSREPLIRRYDHEVIGSTVINPLVGRDEEGPSNGGVIAPLPGSTRGFVLTAGINPFYSEVDTYDMAAHAVDEAVRNCVALGADPDAIALLDNFCWPDPVYDPDRTPDGRYKLAQLVRAARGLHDTAVAYKTPFISGKDSMKNDYRIGGHRVSVLPTVLVSALGIVPDVRECVTSDFKEPGQRVYLLGETGPALGCSYLYRLYGGSSGSIPRVDPAKNSRLYETYHRLVRSGVLRSGHDLAEGGLAVALAESCIGGGRGVEVDIGTLRRTESLTALQALFSESPGRFLVSVDPVREREFTEELEGMAVHALGTTTDDGRLEISDGGEGLVSLSVDRLIDFFRRPLYGVLGMEADAGDPPGDPPGDTSGDPSGRTTGDPS